MPELTFADFQPGQVHDLGSVVVTEQEITEFARRFDPLLFHIDPRPPKRPSLAG